jgi:hypothetical protein
VAVGIRHPQALDRVLFEIELDQDGRLLSFDPAIMTWLDDNETWSHEIQTATITKKKLDVASGQKSHMCVHAVFGFHNRLHVGRPPEARRVYQPFNSARTGLESIVPHAGYFAVIRS